MGLKLKEQPHSPEMYERMEPPLAVVNACHPGAWERVGGVPLVARTLFHLNEFGIRRVALLLARNKILADLKKWQRNLQVEPLRLKEDIAKTILTLKNFEPYVIYIDAAHLIDPRLIHALTVASEPTMAFVDPSDKEKQAIRAGFLTRQDLHVWSRQGKAALIQRSRTLLPEDIDPFSPEIRGRSRPYFMGVSSRKEAQKATSLLIRSQQKQVMDLPAQFIDPPFENMVTRLLCNTPVTPNMVTFAGVGVGVVVAWFFWHGSFLPGAISMFIVEVLDGVDGKLARTKLHFTNLGRYEDLIDYFNETGWYIALAVGLAHTGLRPSPGLLAGLLICSDTADNILYTLASKWYGKSIDLFGSFDRAFRRIAGRRNIYGAMFIIGFSLGYPSYTFAVVAAWAAVTASIHSYRIFQFGRGLKRRLSQPAE
jgi:phosphatidylglycerophosphate synthase